jgi:signal transduction histidine kinase
METLLDDLLEYSRAGRKASEPESIPFGRVVETVLGLLDVGAHRVEVRGGDELVYAPRAPLELVIRNLLANAIKHHDRSTGFIVLTATREDGWDVVEIADDGPGIPPEHHERIFKMFQTLRPRDERGGSGMGLAVVKRVLEAHGARIEVRSAGRGTTMRTRWPSRPSAIAATSGATASPVEEITS